MRIVDCRSLKCSGILTTFILFVSRLGFWAIWFLTLYLYNEYEWNGLFLLLLFLWNIHRGLVFLTWQGIWEILYRWNWRRVTETRLLVFACMLLVLSRCESLEYTDISHPITLSSPLPNHDPFCELSHGRGYLTWLFIIWHDKFGILLPTQWQ